MRTMEFDGNQKSKPSTDEKQSAGGSIRMGSHTKKTLHSISDGDISGSQPRHIPPDIQKRVGTTQDSKSVNITKGAETSASNTDTASFFCSITKSTNPNLMDSFNDADLIPDGTNAIKIDDSRSEDDVNNLQMTPGEKLCEHELAVIFSNSWVSPRDLLNFRLVSKSWRDAATAILLQRDALFVELCQESNRAPGCIRHFYINKREKKMYAKSLTQLTELISSSAKFPSTNFRIQTSQTFTPYTHFPDFMHFFKLHGSKIKTLRPDGCITKKCLLQVLLVYTPTLEHLDLSKARIMELNEEKDCEENALEWTLKTFPFKSLTIGKFYPDYCGHPDDYYEEHEFRSCDTAGRDLVHFILSSHSRLSSIENVTLQTLQMVLIQGKGHLVQSFTYDLFYDNMVDESDAIMTKFLALSPTLSTVALDCLDFIGNSTPHVVFITSVNTFIQSFKNTVLSLSISVPYVDTPWDNLLIIPPMKKLKSLTVVVETQCTCSDDDDDDDGRAECRGCAEDYEYETNMDLRGKIFQFEDGISAENYFPNLMEVSLNSNVSSGNPDVSLMNLFLFKLATNGSSVNWNCFPKVDILNVTWSHMESELRLQDSCQSPAKPPLISKVFQNIRILKFRCGDDYHLAWELWALFSKVELIEIYGIERSSMCSSEYEAYGHVDEAFTGRATGKTLEKRNRWAAELFCEADDSDDSDELTSAPTVRSISDLRHLRELKLVFVGKWSTQFASSVTGLHAFSKMPNTKFVISYDPEIVLNRDRAKFSYSDYGDGDDSAESNDGNGKAQKHFSYDLNEEEEKAGREKCGVGNDGGGNKIVENPTEGNDGEENDDDEITKYEELVFGAIKPYVHIVHEEQNY